MQSGVVSHPKQQRHDARPQDPASCPKVVCTEEQRPQHSHMTCLNHGYWKQAAIAIAEAIAVAIAITRIVAGVAAAAAVK